jgi:uncharacterized protein YaaN involved in tellurite resistance
MADDVTQPAEETSTQLAEETPTQLAEETSTQLAGIDLGSTELAIPEEPEKALVSVKKLPEAELKQATDLAAQIDPRDAQCVLAFGTKPQSALSAATEQIIGSSTTSAVGDAGKSLTELLDTLKEADLDSMQGMIERLVAKLPVIGGFFTEAKQILSAYEPVANKITKIEARLHEQQMTLLTDYENLNKMYGENAQFIKMLEIYVAAGQMKVQELQAELVKREADPASGADSLAAQELDDLRRGIERLGQRIYDLELTRLIAIQTGPQIRLIQDGDERLASKIHTAVLTTIPLWKSQVALAISLSHQKEALEGVKGVTETTNELLRKNSEMLRTGTNEVRRETERGIVDVETLRMTTDNLIATVEEAIAISKEGRARRAEGEKQILEMENRIKTVLAAKQKEIAAF